MAQRGAGGVTEWDPVEYLSYLNLVIQVDSEMDRKERKGGRLSGQNDVEKLIELKGYQPQMDGANRSCLCD
jgi:hypothetical protein